MRCRSCALARTIVIGVYHVICASEHRPCDATDLPPLPDQEDFWYPDWRLAWEEELDDDTRRRISRAVRGVRALSDPHEAAFAVTLPLQSPTSPDRRPETTARRGVP
jgi:hypothetical protein